MGNDQLFKALGNINRMKMIRILINREMHLSGLARELGISVPVVSRHLKVLENAGLIKKRIVGNVYLLTAKIKSLDELLEPFAEELLVEIDKNENLFDAIKQIPGVEVSMVGNKQYITSIDGERGYFIYEVDGFPPKKAIDEYKPQKDVTVDLKKLVAVRKKKIKVNVRKRKNKEN